MGTELAGSQEALRAVRFRGQEGPFLRRHPAGPSTLAAIIFIKAEICGRPALEATAMRGSGERGGARKGH